MIDPTMQAKLLQAPYIVHDFVVGEEACNYELYLLELLNHSNWFSERYPGVFTRPCSESNGECDARNEYYQIDFKLLASKTALQARSVLSHQISKDESGWVTYSTSKNPGGSLQVTRLFAALRGKSVEDLLFVRANSGKQIGVENDICTMLKKLETKKNLLLFFPYEFSFSIKHSFDEGAECIREALTNDFCRALEYRNVQTGLIYDTFLTCVYSDCFLLFTFKNFLLELIDKIETNKMPTYRKLGRYVEWC